MAIFSTPSGPFDFTFNLAFPALQSIQQASGGQFDYTFEILFQGRATIKGSVGGSTFQRSGRNYNIRHHSIPTLKRSIAQLTRRAIFRGNIDFYRTLTDMQKAVWNAAKFTYPRTRSDGTLRVPNRYHLFISSNQRAAFSNVNPITVIGDQYPDQAFRILSAAIDFNTNTGSFTFTGSIVPAGSNMQVFASRIAEAGSRQLLRSRPRLFLIIDEGDPVNLNWFTDYNTIWPGMPTDPGLLFFIAAFLVPLDTGQPQSAGSGYGITL